MKDKYLEIKREKSKKRWTGILWNMAKENKSDYDSLRGTEVVEFFDLFESYQNNIEAKKKAFKGQKRK